MPERTSEEILEMARGEIAARKAHSIALRSMRELPWRYAFIGLAGVLLLGLLAWPGLVTVLYLLALGRARAAKLPPLPIAITLIGFVVIMGIDGINSLLVDIFMPHLYTPRNELRTLTGIGMGVAMAVLMFLIMNISLRQNPDSGQRVMAGWLELGGALLLNLLVLAAMYGNLALMFWPIAITAWLGITGILYAINLLLTALFMGYEGKVLRVVQLAKPATWALLFTLIELGALSAGRFWLEAQGLIVAG
jgi:hypothetical protein